MSVFLSMTAADPVMVCLQSMAPHKTQWVAINFNVNAKPESLISDLEKAGWRDESMQLPIQPLDERVQIELQKPGTGIFNSWTPAEKRQRVAEVKKILVANGVDQIYTQKLTALDCM